MRKRCRFQMDFFRKSKLLFILCSDRDKKSLSRSILLGVNEPLEVVIPSSMKE